MMTEMEAAPDAAVAAMAVEEAEISFGEETIRCVQIPLSCTVV